MLNDYQIKTLADSASLIEPFNIDRLQPHSYDCTLGWEVKLAQYDHFTEMKRWTSFNLKDRNFKLEHGEFALSGTTEYLKLPDTIAGFVQGKSTIGRNGLQIECAGLVDAGFEGNITLELYNMAPWPIVLKEGQPICQIHFVYVDSPIYKDYAATGHYNKQKGATVPVYSL